MKDEHTKKASSESELRRLTTTRDEDLDLRDIPEVRDWSGAARGVFYRPVKQQITLRLDADVVAWFKAQCPEGGYQTAINRALREHVLGIQQRSEE